MWVVQTATSNTTSSRASSGLLKKDLFSTSHGTEQKYSRITANPDVRSATLPQ